MFGIGIMNIMCGTSIQKIGTTTYDATGLGALISISALEQYASSLPTEGYIKYILARSGGAGSDVTIVTKFFKSGTNTLCQSAFRLATTLSVDSITSIISYSNDDHDTLCMLGNKNGIISDTNTSTWNDSFFVFNGSSVLQSNVPLNSAAPYTPRSVIVSGQYSTILAFPASNTTVYINFTAGTYKVNDFTSKSLPSSITSVIGTGAVANSLMTVSDGVNCFSLFRYNGSQRVYAELNLTTGEIINVTTSSFTAVYGNSTEEDSVGDQLFAVDGKIGYYEALTFRIGTLPWREAINLNYTNGYSVGTINTQTGRDIMSSIDANNRVWFADWGHDNGGLFNFGNDSTLGIGRSNIYLLTSTFVD